MACPEYPGLIWACDWQTMIAGIVAVVGAVGGGALAYRAGVRQADATTNSANAEIEAIKQQTAALEQQNADLKRADQRRLARERLTAARMLYISLGFVANDISKAHSMFSAPPEGGPPIPIIAQAATSIRRTVGKPHFDYFWEKVGNFDREDIAGAFLVLEEFIDQLLEEKGSTSMGVLKNRLDNLSKAVEHLRNLAADEMGKARGFLSADDLPR
jgi:hypothetical protein